MGKKKKNRDNYIKTTLIVITFLTAIFMTVRLSQKAMESGSQMICVRVGTQHINGYSVETEDAVEHVYVFLPSFSKPEDTRIGMLSAAFRDEHGKRYHGGTRVGKIPLNTPIDCIYEKTKKPFVLTFMKSDNLSTIFINTSSNSMDYIHASKDNKESARVMALNSDGRLDFDGALSTIKGRGNYTWSNWEKKSYTIGLQRATNLLGLGHGEKYALFANASDATLLRNELGRQMDVAVGVPYAKTGVFVDLYLNGDYAGNYYLCSSMGVGPDQIDIQDMDGKMKAFYQHTRMDAFDDVETGEWKAKDLPTLLEDITGGYLLEREFIDRYKLEYADYMGAFITKEEECFIVKSPGYCSKEQILYLKTLLDNVEADILSIGNSELINADTFAQRIVVEEFTKNYDAGVSSAYFYKDSDNVDGRLCAGPGWDYDMSLGNYLDWMEYYTEGPEGLTKLHVSGYASDWYEKMYDNPKMQELMVAYYKNKLSPYLEDLLENQLKNYEKNLKASAQMDAVRWNQMYQEKGYVAGDTKEYKRLSAFIKGRKEFLDRYIE